jgi:hypothetical protein
MTMFTSAGVPPSPPSDPDVSEELLDEDEDEDGNDELELEDVEATFVVGSA